jgi:signal transduction histidine kinase
MNYKEPPSNSRAENSRIAAKAGIFYDEITVEPAEINREMHHRTRHYLNLLIWSALFLYPLFTFLDFLFVEQHWLNFLLIRIILLAGVYILYDYSSQNDRWILAPIHLLLAGIGLQVVSFSVLVPLTGFYYYMVAWTIIFIAVNLVMLWQPFNGLTQLFVAIGLFFGIHYWFSPHPLNLLVESGGMFFMITATISVFVPAVRYEYESRKVTMEIFRRKANIRLEDQVAEIVRQKELLEQRGAELKKFNDQKTRYLNISTHGIKNPINGILGLIELIKIQYEDLPEDLIDRLTDIEDSALKINEVVDQYLDVQAIENEEQDLPLEPLELKRVIDSIVGVIQREADQRYITIQYLKPPRELPVFAHPAFLNQAMTSLLKYAILLSHNNSMVKVVLEQEGHKVRCHISQTQTTVDFVALDEMFNRLETLTEEGKSAKSSSGVGLSLSRQLLRRMRATLYYTSNQQTGLYFLIEFNLANLFNYNEITY